MNSKISAILDLKNRPISNVEYIFLSENTAKSFKQLAELKTIVKKYDIQHVISLVINPLLPSLAIRRYNFSISGIVFNPYNPNYEKYSFFKRILKEIYYRLVSRKKNVTKLFVLNDRKSCEWLNRHFRINKFCYLPDPVSFYEKETLTPEVLEIKKMRKIALHFGVMSERKGTLLILDAIGLLPQKILSRLTFFFVGKPDNDEFEKLIEYKIMDLRSKQSEVSIYYCPCFVSNGQMESYYETADFVLMPYLSNNMSSGVLGYAAKHNKPVITGRGLLGEIVEEYGLGLSIQSDINDLKNAIEQLVYNKTNFIRTKGKDYIIDHNINKFNEQIMNCW
ncbi:hypothetical protein FACS189438_0490 [Bacteroidia bacterium]|nr:hypothetical protein FACS189438_0490 [Bacteroidia bacterium]